jgi:multisubunit Na+/H+ antiporter MnhB subunit
MDTIASLSTGTKLILGAGTLLFFDLFFTWQSVEQRFNKKFTFTQSLDGWDAWGLLLGLLTLAVLTLAVIRLTSLELSPEAPWNQITLGLGGAMFLVALVKNVTDEGSAVASYVGVALAAAVAAGAYLDRDRPEPIRERSYRDEWTPRVRPTPEHPEQNGGVTARRAPAEPRSAQPRPTESAKRW